MTEEPALRDAARDLLRIAQKYPQAWANLCSALTEEDMAALRELAELPLNAERLGTEGAE